MLLPDAQKKCPPGLVAREGKKIMDAPKHSPRPRKTQVENHGVGKIPASKGLAPLSTWPNPDHPFSNQLREDSNFVWQRMMASVCPAESLLTSEVPNEFAK